MAIHGCHLRSASETFPMIGRMTDRRARSPRAQSTGTARSVRRRPDAADQSLLPPLNRTDAAILPESAGRLDDARGMRKIGTSRAADGRLSSLETRMYC